ncbi:hypothetical protein GGR52DRAFT_544527 [Hypoxylon sp. FL1284]|nr:hypothetical protein GGR52DRAFT_544527 [Hypoxylon sp. FL1284]
MDTRLSSLSLSEKMGNWGIRGGRAFHCRCRAPAFQKSNRRIFLFFFFCFYGHRPFLFLLDGCNATSLVGTKSFLVADGSLPRHGRARALHARTDRAMMGEKRGQRGRCRCVGMDEIGHLPVSSRVRNKMTACFCMHTGPSAGSLAAVTRILHCKSAEVLYFAGRP